MTEWSETNPPFNAARAVLKEAAEPWVLEQAQKLFMSGQYRWEWDPCVPNVVGLLKDGTNNAVLVVYLEAKDFEMSADFEMEMSE